MSLDTTGECVGRRECSLSRTRPGVACSSGGTTVNRYPVALLACIAFACGAMPEVAQAQSAGSTPSATAQPAAGQGTLQAATGSQAAPTSQVAPTGQASPTSQ